MALSIPAVHVPRFRRSRQLHFKPSLVAPRLPIARLIAVLLASFGGIVVDQTAGGISTTSVNFIQGSFGLTQDEGSWILTAFNAAYFTAIFISAWATTNFGRKRTVLAGLLGFAVFSWLCAYAWNVEELIALRSLQGFALGLVFVPAVTTVIASVPRSLLGYGFLPFTVTSLSASTVGVFLGGVFVQYAEWQDVFVVMSAFAVAVAIVVAYVYPTDHGAKRRPFDYVGAIAIFIAFVAFEYVVNEGERRDYFNDPGIVLAVVTMIVSIAGFILWKLHLSRHPFFNLRLFKKVSLTLGTLLVGLLALAQYSGTILAQYSQVAGTEFSPTVAGGIWALRIATFVVGVPLAGLLIIKLKVNVRIVLTVALAAFAVLTFWQADRMTSTADFGAFAGIALLLGLFQGMVNQPIPSLMFGSLTIVEYVFGALIYKMTPQLGGAIALAISQRLVEVRTAQNLSDFAGSATLNRPDIASFVANANVHVLAAYVNQEASVVAYDDVTRIFGAVALLMIPVLYLIRLPGAKTAKR